MTGSDSQLRPFVPSDSSGAALPFAEYLSQWDVSDQWLRAKKRVAAGDFSSACDIFSEANLWEYLDRNPLAAAEYCLEWAWALHMQKKPESDVIATLENAKGHIWKHQQSPTTEVEKSPSEPLRTCIFDALLQVYLLDNGPDGFVNAIRIGEEYDESPGTGAPAARVLFQLAIAYARRERYPEQFYSESLIPSAPAGESIDSEDVSRTIDTLLRAKSLHEDSIRDLLTLRDGDVDDFAGCRNNPKFNELLRPTGPDPSAT